MFVLIGFTPLREKVPAVLLSVYRFCGLRYYGRELSESLPCETLRSGLVVVGWALIWVPVVVVIFAQSFNP